MNVYELEEFVAREFYSFQDAKLRGDDIRNLVKYTDLLAASLRLSAKQKSRKSKAGLRQRLEFVSADGVMPNGPALAILSAAPDPEKFNPLENANAYHSILSACASGRIPDAILFEVFNYLNKLIPYFRDVVWFKDHFEYEHLERSLRKQMTAASTSDLLVSDTEPEDPIIVAFRQSLRRVADNYIKVRNFAGSIGSILRDLDTDYRRSKLSPHILFETLVWANYYNNLLGVFPPKELFSKSRLNLASLSDEQKSIISYLQSPDVADLELSNMRISPLNGRIPESGSTQIIAVADGNFPLGDFVVGGWTLNIVQIEDPTADPNFRFLHDQPIQINGMPVAVLSPTLSSPRATLIRATTNEVFRPGLTITSDGSPSFDQADSMKEVHGSSFDPFVAKLVELLLAIDVSSEPRNRSIVASLEKLDSYFVSWRDAANAHAFHFFQPLIKLSVFLAARKRFLDRFNEQKQLGNHPETLRDKIIDGRALDAASLRAYFIEILEKFVVDPSDKGEWWKTVWADNNYNGLRLEPDVARDVYYIINPWFVVRGLTLDREVRAAGGSIDFVASSAKADKIHRCGAELKFAHNPKLFDGIEQQLPAYLDDLKANVGLFVSIWCKSGSFPHPKAYSDQNSLEVELNGRVPPGYDIKTLTINASGRPPPSKRQKR